MFVYTLSDILWIQAMKVLIIIGLIWLIAYLVIILKK